mmetsp:Transcript_16877/g.65912  ORF Transcript_16877/g.65912 Transcript_16877/m.65912 type:complete len:340 (-) Transcript_16877:85-1104(-)
MSVLQVVYGVVGAVVALLGVRFLYLWNFRNEDRSRPFRSSSSLSPTHVQMDSDIDNDIYDRLAHHWWDEKKPFSSGLHALTRMRAPYFMDCIEGNLKSKGSRTHKWKDEEILHVVDVGCGGGILSEGLAEEALERGHQFVHVTGVDLAAGAIRVAREHAAEHFGIDAVEEGSDGAWATGNALVKFDYKVGDATALTDVVEEGSADVVVIADVLEHVLDLPAVMREISKVLKPGGLLLFDTVNRTLSSYLVAIVLAQEIPFVSLLPSHTHDWALFLRPNELDTLCESNDIHLLQLDGFRPSINLNLIKGIFNRSLLHKMDFALVQDLSVQYIGCAVKGRH